MPAAADAAHSLRRAKKKREEFAPVVRPANSPLLATFGLSAAPGLSAKAGLERPFGLDVQAIGVPRAGILLVLKVRVVGFPLQFRQGAVTELRPHVDPGALVVVLEAGIVHVGAAGGDYLHLGALAVAAVSAGLIELPEELLEFAAGAGRQQQKRRDHFEYAS